MLHVHRAQLCGLARLRRAQRTLNGLHSRSERIVAQGPGNIGGGRCGLRTSFRRCTGSV